MNIWIEFIKFLLNNLEIIHKFLEILQIFVIIGATIFTANWTHKTFAHKEKIEELKEIKKTIELYHWKMQIFCAQVRDNEVPDEKEMREKLELAELHNRIISLRNLSLYNRPDFREKMQKIVGIWLANDRIEKMEHRSTKKIPQKEREKIWQKFDKEYKEVMKLIDEEANKYI